MNNLTKQIYSITMEGTQSLPCSNGQLIETIFFEHEENANSLALEALNNGYKVLKIKLPLYP